MIVSKASRTARARFKLMLGKAEPVRKGEAREASARGAPAGPWAPVVMDALTQPVRRRGGAPSLYSEALADRIIRGMWEGRFLYQVCAQPGMPDKRTVLKWVDIHPEFRARYFRARVALADALAEQAIMIADDMSRDQLFTGEGNPVAVQRARLRIDTRKWVASKLDPKGWGQRAEVTGEVTHRLLIDRPPEESREQWLERRRAELALPAPGMAPGPRPPAGTILPAMASRGPQGGAAGRGIPAPVSLDADGPEAAPEAS